MCSAAGSPPVLAGAGPAWTRFSHPTYRNTVTVSILSVLKTKGTLYKTVTLLRFWALSVRHAHRNYRRQILRQNLPTVAGVRRLENLSAGGADVDTGGRGAIGRHRFAQHQQVRIALRQPARQQGPVPASVPAARHAELGLRHAAVFGPFDRYREHGVRFAGRDRQSETEARRQPLGNIRPLLGGEFRLVNSAVVLLVQRLGIAGMRQQFVHALAHLRELHRLEIGAHSRVERFPRGAAIHRPERARRRDGGDHAAAAQALARDRKSVV